MQPDQAEQGGRLEAAARILSPTDWSQFDAFMANAAECRKMGQDKRAAAYEGWARDAVGRSMGLAEQVRAALAKEPQP